jgi:hypothetical protein
MPLLVNSVPNLAQGVSQQPDNLRFSGQCDEQINAWATVVEGLVKRPPTNYTKKLQATDPGASLFTHFVKRDETDKYCVTVSLGNTVSIGQVGVIDLETGNKISIAVTSIASSYLTGISDPLADLKALTVADYTFLVNKKKKVRRNRVSKTEDFRNLEDPDNPRYEALVFPKIGDYEKAYSIYIDDSLVGVGSTLQGSEHDATHIPSNDNQAATYISGANDKSAHADTEHIARDLLKTLNDWLPDPSVPDSVISFALDSVNKGVGFEDSGYSASTLGSGGMIGAARPSTEVKYEFNILQYDSSNTLYGNRSAGGNLVMESGAVSSFNLNRRGRGYRTAQAGDVFELEIIKYEISRLDSLGGALAGLMTGSNFTRLRKTVYNRDTVPSTFPSITMPDITATVGTADFTVERNGSVIKLSSNLDFNIRVEDGLANQGLGLAYKEVNSITELPKNCYNNFKIKVRGDTNINQDDYYVRFQTQGREDFGAGSYVETTGWKATLIKGETADGIPYLIEPSTMPIVLIKQSDGTFVLQTPNERVNFVKHNSTIYKIVEDHVSDTTNEPGVGADWREYWIQTTGVSRADAWELNKSYNATRLGWGSRTSGDDGTNPFPSFTDNTINDVFFFKNRLGFLTDSNVVFSEADEYFNFFRTTTQQLLDSAPIDVGLSHTKVAVLKYALPFQEKLMLFSNQSQFVLRGAEVLSPKTVAIAPVTEYDISDSVEPIALGNYIYFTFQRNSFEGVYEYFVDNNTETFNSEEITQHIPKYIAADVKRIAGSQAENTIVIGTSKDAKTLFVYKYFWSNGEKIQSAWMKFTFDRDVRGFDFIDSNLHLITADSEGLHLERLTLEDGIKDTDLDYTLYLDSRVDGSTLTTSYSANTKTTTISDFPYDPTGVEIYTKKGHKVAFTRTSATEGTVGTDLTSTDFFAGVPYDMLYRFSDQTLKQPTERGGRSSSDYAFQTIRSGSLNYAETGHFTVEVTPKFRDTYSYAFNPDVLGSNLTLNNFVPQDGHFRFPVQAQPNDATIQIKSSSALPVKILAAEFESMMIPRSRRYGG